MRNCCQDYGAVQIIGLGGFGLEGVMTGCVPHCLGTVQLHPDVTTDMLTVNVNRQLPKNPAISLPELTNKHLQTELERNAFHMHRCTVAQKALSPFFILINTFLIFIISV